MQIQGLRFSFHLALAVCLGFIGAAVPATGSTEFTITATNVTMPASGNGSTQYTVSGIPITGTLSVTCQYSGPATGANLPTCTYGPVAAPEQVKAGQTVTGTVLFYPYGVAIPQSSQRRGHGPSAALALAGTILLGLGLRRRSREGLLTMLLALASLSGALGFSACTGPMNAMTPGTYEYTLQAANAGTLNNLAAGASANISVTVP